MAVQTIDQTRREKLAAAFSGVLLCPGEDGYDDARRVHNGLIDKSPALNRALQGNGRRC